jgi:hypothetical protein
VFYRVGFFVSRNRTYRGFGRGSPGGFDGREVAENEGENVLAILALLIDAYR